MLRRVLLALPLLLAACGPKQAPEARGPMSDDRGAHAGSFRAPGAQADAAGADMNTQASNAQ